MNNNTNFKLYTTILALTFSAISAIFTIQFFLSFSGSALESALLVALAISLEIMKFLSFPIAKRQIFEKNYIMGLLFGCVASCLLILSMFASWNFLSLHYQTKDNQETVLKADNQVLQTIIDSKLNQIKNLNNQINILVESEKLTRANSLRVELSNLETEISKLKLTTPPSSANSFLINGELRKWIIILVSVLPDISAILLFLIVSSFSLLHYSANAPQVSETPKNGENGKTEIENSNDINPKFIEKIKNRIEKGVYPPSVVDIARFERKGKAFISTVLEMIEKQKIAC